MLYNARGDGPPARVARLVSNFLGEHLRASVRILVVPRNQPPHARFSQASARLAESCGAPSTLPTLF